LITGGDLFESEVFSKAKVKNYFILTFRTLPLQAYTKFPFLNIVLRPSSRAEFVPTDGEALQNEESSGSIHNNVSLAKKDVRRNDFLADLFDIIRQM
jgi:hypothetical protein